jgi:FMN-dependent NADH-azoreductase
VARNRGVSFIGELAKRKENIMANLLHLDASPRGERSVSRQLTAAFIEEWKKLHPSDSVTYRDIGHNPPPHVTEAWVVGAYTPPETHPADARTAMQISDRFVDEFLAADRYVFGVPMHNFSVPSTFKAYIDQIVRVGRTFGVDWKGLVRGRKLLIITARGGDYTPGSPMGVWDYQEPWIRTIFGFIGIEDICFIHAQGLNQGDAARSAGLEKAKRQIAELVKRW